MLSGNSISGPRVINCPIGVGLTLGLGVGVGIAVGEGLGVGVTDSMGVPMAVGEAVLSPSSPPQAAAKTIRTIAVQMNLPTPTLTRVS
jgi:hypothetical protein